MSASSRRRPSRRSCAALDACFRDQGRWNAVAYRPASRFRAFQWIELALSAGLSAGLLGLEARWIRRRLA